MNCPQVHRPTVILFWQKVPQVPFLHGFHLCDSRVGCLCPGKRHKSHSLQSTKHSMPRPACSEQGPALQTNTTTTVTQACCHLAAFPPQPFPILHQPQHHLLFNRTTALPLSCSPLTKGDNQLALLLSSLQQHSNKLAPTSLSSAFRLPPPPQQF